MVEAAFERLLPGARKANKRHILSCALACFDELGVEATTIDVIRQRSGSSVGTIYHHFGNKEGLIAALYFVALDDQLALIKPAIIQAGSVQGAVVSMVRTYLEWVTQQPRLAKFMFMARASVATGAYQEELKERNQQRYGRLQEWLGKGVTTGQIRELPKETYASLLLGQSENYCRAWLSGRVKGSPMEYADVFAGAAWRSVAAVTEIAPNSKD